MIRQKCAALLVLLALVATACSGGSEADGQDAADQRATDAGSAATQSEGALVDAQQLECSMVPDGERIATAISRTAICATALLTDAQKECAGEQAQELAGLPLPEVETRSVTPQIVVESSELQDSLPLELVDTVALVSGVDRALPAVFSFNPIVVDGDGNPVRSADGQVPVFGRNWDSILDGVMQGQAQPPGQGEFALSPIAAESATLEIGESYSLFTVTGFEEEFTYVGAFNSELDEVYQVVLSTNEAVRVLMGGQGLSSISVWLQDSTSAIDGQMLLQEALIDIPGLSVTIVEESQRQSVESGTSVLRNSLAVIMCLPEQVRANFAGRQLGSGATVDQADCLLAAQALDPVRDTFTLEASNC